MMSDEAHAENPFCAGCPHERTAKATANIERGDAHWTRRNPEKHAAGLAKLCVADVRKIKRRLRGGERPYHIARDYPVSFWAIRRIKRGLAWKHVTIEEAAE